MKKRKEEIACIWNICIVSMKAVALGIKLVEGD
jgi:hypothetical protein